MQECSYHPHTYPPYSCSNCGNFIVGARSWRCLPLMHVTVRQLPETELSRWITGTLDSGERLKTDVSDPFYWTAS